jgi:hypothetical protein
MAYNNLPCTTVQACDAWSKEQRSGTPSPFSKMAAAAKWKKPWWLYLGHLSIDFDKIRYTD